MDPGIFVYLILATISATTLTMLLLRAFDELTLALVIAVIVFSLTPIINFGAAVACTLYWLMQGLICAFGWANKIVLYKKENK